jgi:hypothetical protein
MYAITGCALVIVIILGWSIATLIQGPIPTTGLNASQQHELEQIQSGPPSAQQLVYMGEIVLAAASIIGIIFFVMRYKERRKSSG